MIGIDIKNTEKQINKYRASSLQRGPLRNYTSSMTANIIYRNDESDRYKHRVKPDKSQTVPVAYKESPLRDYTSRMTQTIQSVYKCWQWSM